MRAPAALLLVLAVVGVFAAAGGAAQRPPVRAEPIEAEFVQARFLTNYTFTVKPRISVKRVTFEWRLTPPKGDPGCTLFRQQATTRAGTSWVGHATWWHGDQHNCDHTVMDDEGHPGFVVAAAVVETRVRGTWICSGGMRGSDTMTSPYVSGCHKRG